MSSIKPYAGFWKRFAAWLIDGVIITIPALILFGCMIAYVISSLGGVDALAHMKDSFVLEMRLRQCMALLQLVMLVGPMLYFALMESSKLQASLGKMALGIKVVDENGQRLTFWRSLGRNAGKFISAWILSIGYFMAGVTRKKQALHDKMANAYVVDKNFQPGDPLPDVPTHYAALGAIIAVMILLVFLLIALFVGMIAFGIQQSIKASAQETTASWVQQTTNNSLFAQIQNHLQ